MWTRAACITTLAVAACSAEPPRSVVEHATSSAPPASTAVPTSTPPAHPDAAAFQRAADRVRSGDPWDAALAALRPELGEPVLHKRDRYFWYVQDGDWCYGLALQKTGDKVGIQSQSKSARSQISAFERCEGKLDKPNTRIIVGAKLASDPKERSSRHTSALDPRPLLYCFDALVAAVPGTTRATVAIRTTIAPDGKVMHATPDSAESPTLNDCVVSSIRAIQFPTTTQETQVIIEAGFFVDESDL
jgi:hypothetical protein